MRVWWKWNFFLDSREYVELINFLVRGLTKIISRFSNNGISKIDFFVGTFGILGFFLWWRGQREKTASMMKSHLLKNQVDFYEIFEVQKVVRNLNKS